MNAARKFAMPLRNGVLRGKYTLSRCYVSTSRVNEVVKNHPTIASTKSIPYNYRDMDNSNLLVLASLDIKEARIELLKRNIMSVDNIEYDEAEKVFREIAQVNRRGMSAEVFPYQVGIYTALVTGLASFPMCFDVNTVKWFNERFVTTDIPGAEDLETPLEVGSWAWNWMEPPLGQISFFLLCLQFARSQMLNLGVRPYTQTMRHRRATKLAEAYPQYNSEVVKGYSLVDDYIDPEKGFLFSKMKK